MTPANIEAIAASLRNCSLVGRRESPELSPAADIGPPGKEETLEFGEVTVELNSEVALPYHWEQCLDLKTGELYFINWKDGKRTSKDPRLATTRCRPSYCSSEEEISDIDDEEPNEDDEAYFEAEDSSSSVGEVAEYDDFYNNSSELSSGITYRASSSTSTEGSTNSGGQVLVAAGCKSCFMYFMVPKHVESCPKCGGCLLHLGRNGYFQASA